ncbi:hypothetical protein Nepgr_020214 [Nepenthes gracilis]|uniref:WRKY domain-containing protein n=1 Tax=Nepenthes gracilis TaxID=150966 RepID=A0AAD3XV19_NEPGR|nr:hypothetical protein Nepgr_020214 [Nepenthes gracilis]
MEEEWDLYAVVRNHTTAGNVRAEINSAAVDSTVTIINAAVKEASLINFVAPFDMFDFTGATFDNNPFDELGNLYKPFYPETPRPSRRPPAAAVDATNVIGVLNQSVLHLRQIQQQQPQRAAHHYRCRKRKNEQLRTTRQVTAENILSTDNWAWRKYGQKPIKGSPHPRNYYRCSSSKGCTARKYVEKNPTDPNMYVVTYTGDHCHPRPTVRNLLAGSTRTKFYDANNPTYGNPETPAQKTATSSPPISPSSSTGVSLTTPLAAAAMEDGDNVKANCSNAGAIAEENFEIDIADFVNDGGGAEENENADDGFDFLDDLSIPNSMADENLYITMAELEVVKNVNMNGAPSI